MARVQPSPRTAAGFELAAPCEIAVTELLSTPIDSSTDDVAIISEVSSHNKVIVLLPVQSQ